jgi:hypothetical protein
MDLTNEQYSEYTLAAGLKPFEAHKYFDITVYQQFAATRYLVFLSTYYVLQI